MRKFAALPISLALAALSLACATIHAEDISACTRFTPQMAAALLGGPANAPMEMGNVGCAYTAKSGGVSVALAFANEATTTAEDFTRGMKTGSPASTNEQVAGLGEAAFLVPSPNKIMLSVFYHHVNARLAVQKPLTPELKAQMIQTMRQILAKL